MSHQQVNQMIHVMWSTENLKYNYSDDIKKELHSYIAALIKSKEGRVILIGGTENHIHILFILPPTISVSSMIGHIKSYSSKWIKTRPNISTSFTWQTGYLAVSTQQDRMDGICSYIKNENHRHVSMNYVQELTQTLTNLNIPIDEKYFLQNSHSKIFIHAVWSTKGRNCWLDKSLRTELYQEIGHIITKNKGKTIEIGGVEDHVHVLFDTPRHMALSDLIQEIKSFSSHWLTTRFESLRFFDWQNGYGAFSVSLSTLPTVIKYIQNQEEHHKMTGSTEEWNHLIINK